MPALIAVWPVVAIFFASWVASISAGSRRHQAAAVGAAAAQGLVAWVNGGLDRKSLFDCFKETAVSTGMIFFIILAVPRCSTPSSPSPVCRRWARNG